MSLTKQEFDCPCCGMNNINDGFFNRLARARSSTDQVFIINSGCRCEGHNKEVGGSETSSHLDGLAADIKADNSFARFEILKALIKIGFTRIGIGETFIHVDGDKQKVANVTWLY